MVCLLCVYGTLCQLHDELSNFSDDNKQAADIDTDYVDISTELGVLDRIRRRADSPKELRRARAQSRRRRRSTTTISSTVPATAQTITTSDVENRNNTNRKKMTSKIYLRRLLQRKNTIELIKQKILKDLNLVEPPNVNATERGASLQDIVPALGGHKDQLNDAPQTRVNTADVSPENTQLVIFSENCE